jgi:hypothetical protein
MSRFAKLSLASLIASAAILGLLAGLYAQTSVSSRVGPVFQADGTTPLLRASKTGDLVVQMGRGTYSEAVVRGNCYSGMTAVAGVSVASLSQGTTGPFTLANPAGSNKNLAVMNVSMGYVSGTFGAGNLTYSVNTNASAAAVTGTALTPTNNLVGQGNNAVAKLVTTSTLPATPTPIRNFVNLDAFVGTLALMLPEGLGRHQESYRADKLWLLGLEFKTFVRLPCQIVRTGRRVVYRLLSWNPYQPIFFRLVDALRC